MADMNGAPNQWANTPTLADFRDPRLSRFAEQLGIPASEWDKAHRKWWEWARVLETSERAGVLREDSRVLGIGSGHETPIYWFANHVRLVVATDLYGLTPFGASEASDRMMVDPTCFAPIEYDHAALLVERVDARSLPFAAESFDLLFSCSSVEHFGKDADLARAMAEAFRVLKPGGTYALAVDCLIQEGPSWHRSRDKRKGLLGEFVTIQEASQLLVEGPGFEMDAPISVKVDRDVAPVILDSPDPNACFPHLYLSLGQARFTSLYLELRKPETAKIATIPRTPHTLGL